MTAFPDGFGCNRCFQASAEDAAAARFRLVRSACLVDESHFMASLESCPDCGQRCLSVFCETVDWVDSDDPQCRSLLPLTGEEAARLTALGEATDEAKIEAAIAGLRGDRRYLHLDFPKGAPSTAQWHPGGFWIRPHD